MVITKKRLLVPTLALLNMSGVAVGMDNPPPLTLQQVQRDFKNDILGLDLWQLFARAQKLPHQVVWELEDKQERIKLFQKQHQHDQSKTQIELTTQPLQKKVQRLQLMQQFLPQFQQQIQEELKYRCDQYKKLILTIEPWLAQQNEKK